MASPIAPVGGKEMNAEEFVEKLSAARVRQMDKAVNAEFSSEVDMVTLNKILKAIELQMIGERDQQMFRAGLEAAAVFVKTHVVASTRMGHGIVPRYQNDLQGDLLSEAILNLKPGKEVEDGR